MGPKIVSIDLGGVNCYLAKTDSGFVLFDTGGHIVMDKEFNNRRHALEDELLKNGCNADNLHLIVLTHGDNDHAANALYFSKFFNAKIALHKDDEYLVLSPTLDDYMASYHYRSGMLNLVFKMMKKTITGATQKFLSAFKTFKPDILLTDGFDFSAYGFNAKVIHIPGHTPGSIGILFENGDFIAGDLLANNKKPEIIPNANDFKVLNANIGKLKNYDIKTVYPGHGKPFEFSQLAL